MSKIENHALISIIIPVYNTKNYLKRCLDSVLQQSHQNFEVVIIDDGSTDFSADQINEEVIHITQRDSRFRFFHQSNQGAGAARNLGLKHAKGEYIAFIDSDDCVDPDYLQAMYQQIQHDNSLLCFCSVERTLPDNTRKIWTGAYQKDWKGIVDDILLTNVFAGLCNRLFHRHLVAEIGFSQPSGKSEDTVFLVEIMIAKKPNKISYVDKPLYKYYRRDDSMTGSSFDIESVIKYFANLLYLVDLFRKYGIYSQFKNAYSVFILNNYMGEANNLFCEIKDAHVLLLRINQMLNQYSISFPNVFFALLLKIDCFLRPGTGRLSLLKLCIARILLRYPIVCKALQPVARIRRRAKAKIFAKTPFKLR